MTQYQGGQEPRLTAAPTTMSSNFYRWYNSQDERPLTLQLLWRWGGAGGGGYSGVHETQRPVALILCTEECVSRESIEMIFFSVHSVETCSIHENTADRYRHRR